MKKVFSSHRQVAHVWAQQTQESGRANNIFFEGARIYSYGTHYLAAMIHTDKRGNRYALINSGRYSVSTAKHLSIIRNALRGLMPYWESPDPSNPKLAIKHNDALASNTIDSALSRMKVVQQDEITYELKRIHEAFSDASQLRQKLGFRTINTPAKKLAEVKEHLDARLKRYYELNTPEMLTKRAEKRAKREEQLVKQAELALQESISKFRSGEISYISGQLPFELLRIQEDRVITSRGAAVPLDAARRLYEAIKRGADVKGARIGDFTVEYAAARPDRQIVVKIGCHRILLSEADKLFSV